MNLFEIYWIFYFWMKNLGVKYVIVLVNKYSRSRKVIFKIIVIVLVVFIFFWLDF